MDLRSARHVISLARHLSFTRAADELGITQSALSRSIQQLEGDSGVRLFDRDRGGVRLTTLGGVVAAQASVLVREADQLDALLSRSAAGLQEQISFGMAPLVATILLPQTIVNEFDVHPELHASVVVRPPDALLPLLLNGEIEFIVCVEAQLPADVPIKSSSIGLVRKGYMVRDGHPLLAGISDAGYEAFPWIIGSTYSSEVIRGANTLPGLREEAQLVVDDLGCLARIAEQSDAIWVTSPEAAAREIRERRLRELPVPENLSEPGFRIMFYCLARRSLSPAAVRIRDRLRDTCKAIQSNLSGI